MNAVSRLTRFTRAAVLSCILWLSFTLPAHASLGHTNIAYYSFEDNSLSAKDFSGNGNNLGYGWSIAPPRIVTNDAASGTYSVGFDGDGYFQPGMNPGPIFTASFSVSLWLKTTHISGDDTDDGAYDGIGIIPTMSFAGNGFKLALTGSKIAFVTGGSSLETLHSATSFNSGQWLHVVVTRDQSTGEKRIYINGALDTSAPGMTELLTGPPGLQICEPDPNGFTGQLDEIQIYRGVLSPADVGFLYHNPSNAVPNISDSGMLAHYRFDDSGNPGLDSSANHYNMDFTNGWNGGDSSFSASRIAGSGALAFHRYISDPNSGASCGWTSTPPALLSALARNFSISMWLKTVDTTGPGLVSADIPGDADDVVPLALGPSSAQAAFTTGSDSGDDVVYSATRLNDNQWHHVVVTRSQGSGEKKVYIDGLLDNSDYNGYGGHFGPTNLLHAPRKLTIGAVGDASNPDPNDSSYHNGYEGSLDDIQIYSGVLNAVQVGFLYQHPGQEAPAAANLSPDIDLELTIVRNADAYYCYPIVYINPPPLTDHTVESPNRLFQGSANAANYSSALNSLGAVLTECTNGLWKIFLNKDDETETLYTFRVSIAGLTTDMLPPVVITSPANGSINVPTNSPLEWTGPSGFEGVGAEVHNSSGIGVGISLPPTATSWPSPPKLSLGTNELQVYYVTNDIPLITFSIPVDANATPPSTWLVTGNLNTAAVSRFVVTDASGPVPAILLSPRLNGANFQFQFVSQPGVVYLVQYRPNFSSRPDWQTYATVPGDGTLKTILVPLAAFNSAQQGFVRVLIQ